MLWWIIVLGYLKSHHAFKQEAPPSIRWSSSLSYNILKNEYVYQASIYGLVYSMGYNILIEARTSKKIDLTILVNKSKLHTIRV
jgi:hypothetical protein